MLLPVFSAQVSAENPKATYEGRCFGEITFEYSKVDETTFEVLVTTANRKSELCNDVILFANTEIQHFEVFYFHGTHKLTFQMTSPEAQADAGYGGIKAFAFCENIVQDFESLFTTMKAFIGGITDSGKWRPHGSHLPPYMEKTVIEFLKDAGGIDMQTRETQNVEIDPDTVQSGDFLTCMRFDGLGAIIVYGTGSRVAHNVMAMRFDGELYVVESTDPQIMRTPWAEWMEA